MISRRPEATSETPSHFLLARQIKSPNKHSPQKFRNVCGWEDVLCFFFLCVCHNDIMTHFVNTGWVWFELWREPKLCHAASFAGGVWACCQLSGGNMTDSLAERTTWMSQYVKPKASPGLTLLILWLQNKSYSHRIYFSYRSLWWPFSDAVWPSSAVYNSSTVRGWSIVWVFIMRRSMKQFFYEETHKKAILLYAMWVCTWESAIFAS